MTLPHARLAEAADQLTQQLARLGSPKRAAWDRNYLHSDLTHLGIAIPDLRRTVTAARRALPSLTRPDILTLAGIPWSDDVYEHRQAAAHLLTQHTRLLTPADLQIIEAMLRTAHTWALVDTIAVHAAGVIALRHPDDTGPVLDRWATDHDMWLRRSALLTLLRGIRAGNPDLNRLDHYADAMLDERGFFIRKAIGWTLRETSRRNDRFVTAWIEDRLDRTSGVTLREAVRHLPAQDANRLTAAHRTARQARPSARP
ncbi:DNA alkylation repair protein [Amycolatopsis sp. cmx-4-61]|uniref:DNA alkylation repair protein n=1 Tax=Amycolatopsis sp. cmx-4-61 TaxID=2790937 RepID=UPI00397DB720